MSKPYWDHVAGLRDFWEATSAQVVVEALEHLIRKKAREMQAAKGVMDNLDPEDMELGRALDRDAGRLEAVSRVLEN